MELQGKGKHLPAIATLVCLSMTIAAEAATRAELGGAVASIEHTTDVKLAIASAGEHLADLRATQPSPAALLDVHAAIERVAALTVDNPRQQDAVAEAQHLVTRIAGETSAEGRPHDATVADLQARLLDMRATEDALMDTRMRAKRKAQARGTWALSLSALFTLVLGWLTWGRTRRERDALRELAETDELTRLPNRRAFLVRAERARVRAAPFAVLFADVNGLKRINDTFGHEYGDRAIVTAATVLRDTLRDGDLLARLGGDEFAAVLPGVTPGTTARVTRRIREAVDRFNASHPELPFHLSISLGLGCFDPRAARPLSEVLSSADATMYDAKRSRSSSVTLSVIRPLAG